MTHVWWMKKTLADRKGTPCRVISRGKGQGPRNILVEFEDGFKVIATRFSVRRKK